MKVNSIFNILISCVLFTMIISPYSIVAQDTIDEEQRRKLEAELQRAIEEKEKLEVVREQAQKQQEQLDSQEGILNRNIANTQYRINQHLQSVSNLTSEIQLHEVNIRSLDRKLEGDKENLAAIIRRLEEVGSHPPIFLIFAYDTLSDFFNEQADYRVLEGELYNTVVSIQQNKEYISTEKEVLLEDRISEEKLKNLKEIEKQNILKTKEQLDAISDLTKKVGTAVDKQIETHQQEIDRIRAELFPLRDTLGEPIDFGTAVDLAFRVQQKTGVRAAFLLGIIKIESDLGSNVGTGTWDQDMHPVRDRPVFEAMGRTLGFDPDTRPVSAKPWYGWGGAMGPAQFIPSTWACYGGFVNALTNSCGYKSSLGFVTSDGLHEGDSGSRVKKLQQFLVKHGYADENIVKGYYGGQTAAAVKRLQEDYASVLLEPDGLTRGTGNVGPRTTYFINRFEFWNAGWKYDVSKDIIRKELKLSSPSNPWNTQQAFLASSMLLRDNGATSGKKYAEWNAAYYYLGGGPAGRGYANTVEGYANDFQNKIDFLND